MIVVCRIVSAVQRSKEVRTQGASRYKRKVDFLQNAGMKEHVSTPKIDEKFEGVLTPWRRQEGQSQYTERDRPTEGHSLPVDSRGRDK